MTKILITLLFFFSIILVFDTAYTQQRVSGKLADSLSNEALPFATVRLSDQQQHIKATVITDSLGRFNFVRIASGTYSLYFSITGYNAGYFAVFTVKDTDVVLPLYLLSRSKTALATVTINGQRPLITPKIDGFIYNAAQNVQNAGESAADVLRKIPGVQVDQNGVPQMRGGNRVKVFIDGKPSNIYANSVAEALNHISADNIKTVEVITHPSARYDAEGVDGVINIQTKRPANDGLSGTVDGTLATRFREITGALTWKYKHIVVTADYGPSHSTNLTNSVLQRSSLLPGVPTLVQNKETSGFANSTYGGASLIYLPDTLTTMNLGYRYSFDDFGTNTILNSFTSADASTRYINNPLKRPLHGINAGWLHRSADKSTEINVIGYYFHQGQNGSYLLDEYRNNQRDYYELNHNHVDNSEYSFQADVDKKLKNGDALEFGARYSRRMFDYNDSFDVLDLKSQAYLPDPSRSNRFWFNSPAFAAYGAYTLSLQSWKIKGGIRYEQTRRPMHFSDTLLVVADYRNWIPNLIIGKTIAQGQNISIGYTRKMQGPYINYINPIINRIDSLNIEYGNPNIKPAFTNSYDLSYSLQQSAWLLNVFLFYDQTMNDIERVRVDLPGGVVGNTYANISNYNTWGGSFSASLRSKKFTLSTTNTTRHLTFNNQDGGKSKSGFVINQSIDASFKFSKSWNVRTYANINSRGLSLQGYSTGVSSYTFILNKELFDGALNISARCDNLFAPYRNISEFTNDAAFTQRIDTRSINRYFRLALRWKWGKKSVTRPEVRDAGGY